MTPLPKPLCLPVAAKYATTDVEEYDRHPLIRAFGPILSIKEAMRNMRRKFKFDESVRKAPEMVRLHKLQQIMSIVFPLSANRRFYLLFDVLLRRGLLTRNPMDPEFWQRTRSVSEIAPEMFALAEEGRLASSPGGSLIIGKSGVGKTGLLEVVVGLYPKGVYVHCDYEGKRLNILQIPFVICECAPNASILGLLLLLLGELERLAGKNLRRDIPKPLREATLIPYVVKKLVEYNVGMVIVDEAQNLTARYSGGGKAMLFFFINLMNTSSIPLMLMANPEFLDAIDDWFKGDIRFCSGGRLELDHLVPEGELDSFVEYMWKHQFLVTYTKRTPALTNQLYECSQGILEMELLTYKWTQELAIERGGDEIITPALMQEAFRLKGKSLEAKMQAIAGNTKASLQQFADLGRPVIRKRKPGQPLPAKTDALYLGEPATSGSTPPKPSPAFTLPKRGNMTPTSLICYGKKEFRGDMSTPAIMEVDGYIAYSTEFWTG